MCIILISSPNLQNHLTVIAETSLPSHFPSWISCAFFLPMLAGTGTHFTLLPGSGTHLHFLTRTHTHIHFPCQKRCTYLCSLLEQLHSLPCPGETCLCFPLTCLDPVPFSLSWVLTGHFHTLAGLTWHFKMEVTYSSETSIILTN
jgi:hypothetical protein